MTEKPILLGAVVSSMLASVCCILPLTAGVLGAGAVAAGLAFESFRLWFALGAASLLGFGFNRYSVHLSEAHDYSDRRNGT